MFIKRQSATPPRVLHFSVSDGAELCLGDMDQLVIHVDVLGYYSNKIFS